MSDPIRHIPNIQIQTVGNNVHYIPRWINNQPSVDYLMRPVVVNIGIPIIDMPGCVKAHTEENRKTKLLPNLADDDPKEIMTLCPDGFYPSYDAMNYEPDQLIITREQKAPPVAPPEDPPGAPETPDTGDVAPEGDPECPGPTAPRIGDVAQNKKEKVSGFELVDTPRGKVCEVLYEDIGVVEAYLPAPQVVTTTATIAAVATGSALLAKPLADLLMKVVKPVIKKVMTKIQTMLGKTPYRPTQAELKTNEYRLKKGLLEINFAKQHSKKMKAEKK